VLPQGFAGVLATLPFAVWLFLAIEQLPLAAEESADPKKDMPRALILGMTTLMVSALLTVFLNSGVGSLERTRCRAPRRSRSPRAAPRRIPRDLGRRRGEDPRVPRGDRPHRELPHDHLRVRAADLFPRPAGYYLDFMSLTSGKHKVPHMALFAGHAARPRDDAGRVVRRRREGRGAVIGGTLLNMAVFGAMISYAMQGLSFILLRRNLPHIERPYRSPLGTWGAGVTIVIALVTLYYQLQDPVYRDGVYAVAVFYALGLLYFALIGRHRLILSPGGRVRHEPRRARPTREALAREPPIGAEGQAGNHAGVQDHFPVHRTQLSQRGPQLRRALLALLGFERELEELHGRGQPPHEFARARVALADAADPRHRPPRAAPPRA
jgi:ethanolamine permease